MRDTTYEDIAQAVTVIVFVAVWIYQAFAYGIIGIGLGWLPAMIIGGVVGILWPLIAMFVFGYYMIHLGGMVL